VVGHGRACTTGKPNNVKWGHALVGGVFVAAGIALPKNALALYSNAVPTMVCDKFRNPCRFCWCGFI
jgi:hypothetical protein